MGALGGLGLRVGTDGHSVLREVCPGVRGLLCGLLRGGWCEVRPHEGVRNCRPRGHQICSAVPTGDHPLLWVGACGKGGDLEDEHGASLLPIHEDMFVGVVSRGR